jgi:hypothetical protein
VCTLRRCHINELIVAGLVQLRTCPAIRTMRRTILVVYRCILPLLLPVATSAF